VCTTEFYRIRVKRKKGICELSKKGSGGTWILGAIVILLCINAAYALIELVILGSEGSINILLLIRGTYDVPVSAYFLASVLAAAVSFGYLCSSSNSRFTVEAAVAKMLDVVEAKLQHNQEHVEGVLTEKLAALSLGEFEVTEGFKNIEMQLGENRKGMEKLGSTRFRNGKAMKRQIRELAYIKKKIEEIESRLAPKPRLTSRSDIREISGVGKKTSQELKSVGVTNVEGVIVEDPAVIAHETKLSKKKIEKIRATAQLLMIPGIDGKKAKLLQKAGITSLDKLSNQNSIQLFKKVVNIAKNGDDTPSLEEIASYIQFARFNFSAFD
jgi:predicted flap endonuclease-1-like 5' DNA nuclease